MPNWEWKGDHGEQLRDLSWLALPAASPLPQAVTQRAARPPTLVRAVAEQKLVSAQSVYGKQQAGATTHCLSLTLYISLSPESPFELLFWRPRRGHVDGEQELFEIYEPIFVRVKGAEDVVAELLCVAAREEQLVHVNELGRGQPAIGAVLLEALIPLLDCVLVVARVRLQELKVLLAQSLLALNAAHAACP